MKKVLFFKHIKIEGPGLIGEILESRGIPFEVVNVYEGAAFPDNLENLGALFFLGGPMNVYEEDSYPFLVRENVFIQRCIKAGIPMFGICLGAQLIAKALGARVRKGREKELGWGTILLTNEGSNDPLFANMGKSVPVFQWHGDTFDIPEGAVHLAASDKCENQAFRYGKLVYGFQFHCEVSQGMGLEWTKAYEDELQTLAHPMSYDDVKKTAPAHEGKTIKAGRAMFERFISLISFASAT